jgi:hypothetical protein
MQSSFRAKDEPWSVACTSLHRINGERDDGPSRSLAYASNALGARLRRAGDPPAERGAFIRASAVITKLLIALTLMALCVVIHAAGLAGVVRRSRGKRESQLGYWKRTWLFVYLAAWIILLHLIEIIAWALYYLRRGAFDELQSALYFSAVTYTTTGYGDLVLPEEWRLLGGVEALTGILMCGWSTGFFFAVVSRMYAPEPETTET